MPLWLFIPVTLYALFMVAVAAETPSGGPAAALLATLVVLLCLTEAGVIT